MADEDGLDYSDGRPGGAAIADGGYRFAMRYLNYGNGLWPKAITPYEREDLYAHGIDIGFIMEKWAERALEGFDAGRKDAQDALHSLQVLNAPPVAVYFAIDFDAQPSQFAALADYFAGILSVLPPERVGIYGSYQVLVAAQQRGWASKFWQTYAWSGGNHFATRHLFQYRNGGIVNGASVDFNLRYGDDQGLWKAHQEDDMEDKVLREAMASREAVRRFASDPDHLKVQAGEKLLRDAGLIP